MCQLNLNAAKTSIRSKTFHSKAISHATLTKKHSPNVGMRSRHSFKKNQPSPMAYANGTVLNSYLKKNYDRNHQSSPDAYNLMQLWQIAWVYHPCSTHFHIHLCTTACVVCQNPHNTAPPMLPWKMHETPHDHMSFLAHCKTYVPCHLEASHAWPPKTFSALSHCSHFWPLHSLC